VQGWAENEGIIYGNVYGARNVSGRVSTTYTTPAQIRI